MKVFNICIWILVFLIATQVRVQAYTDPGSGSLILQMLLAASFGALFYVRRFVNWLRGLKARKSAAPHQER
jgi:hypothetical protein